jgi:hypothetical protein
MQLVIPGLADLPRSDIGGIERYELVPGATLELHPLEPLPAELDTWGQRVVGTERVRLLAVREDTTDVGWPVTIAASELLDEAGATVEIRMHMLFRFLEYAGIAVVRATDTAAFDQAFPLVQPLVPFARPDFSGQVVALAQVWAGL